MVMPAYGNANFLKGILLEHAINVRYILQFIVPADINQAVYNFWYGHL